MQQFRTGTKAGSSIQQVHTYISGAEKMSEWIQVGRSQGILYSIYKQRLASEGDKVDIRIFTLSHKVLYTM
jgi:hypothetical protein